MYYYKKTDTRLWTVGHDTPSGEWEAESDHGSIGEAIARVSFLNGGEITLSPIYNEQIRAALEARKPAVAAYRAAEEAVAIAKHNHSVKVETFRAFAKAFDSMRNSTAQADQELFDAIQKQAEAAANLNEIQIAFDDLIAQREEERINATD